MDRTEFKKRMQSLKSYREQNPDKGYWDWRNSLPDDLPYTDDLVYDMRGAYESGAQPELQDDGTYHLPTRDSRNGRILKKSIHPTYWKGLEIDAGLDYNPYFFGDVTYTWNDKDGALIPWRKVEQFDGGGEINNLSQLQNIPVSDQYKQRYPNLIKLDRFNPAKDQYSPTVSSTIEYFSKADSLIYTPILDRVESYLQNNDITTQQEKDNAKLAVNMLLADRAFGLPDNWNGLTKGQKLINENIQKLTDRDIKKIINTDMLHIGPVEAIKIIPKGLSLKDMWQIKKYVTSEDFRNDYFGASRFADWLRIGGENDINNPLWFTEDWSKYSKGGEVPPDNSPVHVNPFTKKPLANGAITPVLDLEGAANFTPAGDVLSIRDAYVAAKNNDLLGLGLAGLGFLPFVPRIGRSKVSKVNRPPIPEVHPNYFQEQMEKAEKAAAKRKQAVNDFYTQQDQTYESLIENEDAFRRAVNADATAGTNYTGVYGDYLKNYSRGTSRYNDNLTSIRLTDDIPSEAKAQVDPRNLNWIRVNSRYADPDELDPVFQQMNPGLVRHELGHVTDEKAGLDYVNKLGNRSKFESESKLKEMFPKTYKRVQDYLLRGSEIKSHMNEFRDYLYSIGQYSSTETAKSLRQKLDKYGSNFKNLKILFDAYKNKRQFARDYNTIPLIGTSALGINYYLNQEEQRRD